MRKVYTVESELANALILFSSGKLTVGQARQKAKEIAPNYDMDNEMLAHKGINWYAKQILKKMGIL